MKLYRESGYENACRRAANIISAQINLKPDSVVVWPTGSTPIGVYAKLVEMHKRGDLDFSEVTCFNLDEYRGLARGDSQSYHTFMDGQLLNHVNIPDERAHFLNGKAADIEKECTRYEDLIASVGGVDLAFLGIGNNGHIAFNEPDTSFSARTRLVDLEEDTIQANARFFDDPSEVPRQALSMGIGSMMRARKIVLVASGPAKTEIMNKALYGPIVPEVPGSILQFHPDVTVVWSET